MIFVPKPPPTSGATTSTLNSGSPKSPASPFLMGSGAWVESQTLRLRRRGSHSATTPRASIGLPQLRSIASRSRRTRGARERAVGVADRLSEARGAVVRHVGVHARHAGRERRRQIGHDRQRLVLHVDERERVLGDVAALRDDEGHNLADVAHLVDRERPLGPSVRQGRMRDQERRRLIELAELGRRHHQADRGHATGGGRVNPRDPRVRVRAPQRRGVERTRRIHVVDEAAEAP